MSESSLPIVSPDDVDSPPDGVSGDCGDCGGEGTWECDECGGSGADPDGEEGVTCWGCLGSTYQECNTCDGSALSLGTRKRIAAEATRLWHRDVGRGVTTGTVNVYVDLAVLSLRESQEAA